MTQSPSTNNTMTRLSPSARRSFAAHRPELRYTNLLSLRRQREELTRALSEWELAERNPSASARRRHCPPPLALRALHLAVSHELRGVEAVWSGEVGAGQAA